MKKIFTAIIFSTFIACISLNAQTNTFPSTGAAGIGTTSPHASSLMEIKSTTKGFLMSRMTLAQRNAIATPATGLMIYQTNNTPGFYYYTGSGWKAVTPKAGWSLTGNAGTDSSINFLGTTDAHPLVFKVNNVKAGYLDYDVAKGNTSFGFLGLNANTTGTSNTANGMYTLYLNTIGTQNTATGYASLYSNISGNYNSAHGAGALNSNTKGAWNTANGAYAMYLNKSGDYNTAIGGNALYNNTTGVNNTATGSTALQNNTTSSNNTANGWAALYSNNGGNRNTALGAATLNGNVTGNDNTATGFAALNWNNADNNTATGAYALYLNTSGYSNIAIGTHALFSNTINTRLVAVGDSALYNNGIGALNNLDGVFNTAIGSKALYLNTKGSWNTANGYQALYSNTTGLSNTANGSFALSSNTTGIGNAAYGVQSLDHNLDGYRNTGIGDFALSGNTHGNFNTALGEQSLIVNTVGGFNTAVGYHADVSVNNLINSTAIGANAIVNNYNKITLGDGSITLVESNGGFWTTSDGRFKNNIKENVKGLEFIKLLKPITYNFDTKKFSGFLMQNYPDSIKQKRLAAIDKEATAKASSVVQSGFVAQDVAEAVKKSGYNFNGVHAPENPTDNWSLSYEKLVVPLVRAVQELSKMNDDKDAKINALETRLSKIEEQLKINASTVSFTDATLDQNIPNPFTNSTVINYAIPQKFTNAQILITDKSGKALKTVNISGTGKGNLKVDAATLASGAYQYSLVVDGKLIGTKQMVLAK